MSSRREELAQRRAQLIARASEQRVQLCYDYEQLERPVRMAALATGFIASLRRSPLFITALAAVLVKTPWRKLARLPKWAWRGWRFARFVRGFVR